jgi:predicted transcriptional regulator
MKCLNCSEQLNNDQNYCPNCGQENSDKKLALGAFLKDFFSNYLSFDTILFKTLNPFIFRPGKLTKAFNEGKRKRYINPIRLYLIFSLFYFFMISLTVPRDFIDTSLKEYVNKKSILDSLKIEELDSAGIQQLIKKAEQNKLVNQEDSINKWATLKYWAADETLSDDEFEANLEKVGGNIEEIPAKYKRSFLLNSTMFTYQAIRNLPLMMFFFLPIFALILYLLFMRGRFYMEHLIHGLHLHAFAYFIYGLAILLISLFSKAENWIIFLSFIWVSAYALFSIKRLYQNSWTKSIFKFFILGFFYFILLLLGFALELYISFLTL